VVYGLFILKEVAQITWKSEDCGMSDPSLNHCTVGLGTPVICVLNWAGPPSITVTSASLATVGATSTELGAVRKKIISQHVN